MSKYVLKRLMYMFISLLLLSRLPFLNEIMPGSPFNDAKLNAEQKAILNENMV